jgi:hypothetical protein
VRDRYYDQKKKVPVVCLAGARFWQLRPEKKIQWSVWRVLLLCQFLVLAGNWQFFCCGGKFLLRPEKKNTVVCLAVARSFLRPENKKVLVVCLAGAQSLLRPEKKKF